MPDLILLSQLLHSAVPILDIDYYINCGPRVFALVLFCFVSGCADVNKQSLLAEHTGRDGKKPIGRLKWVMLLFGEFHY